MFDGYSDKPSTKDCDQMGRSCGTIGVTVHFTSSMVHQTKKEEFLSNKHNKQRFIALLSQRLEQAGCEIHQSRGDADVLIVQTALTSSAKLSKKPFWLGTIQICVCSSSFMKITSGITSSDLKLDGRVRRQKKDAGISLLGSVVTNNIMFIHAILGCNTTSCVTVWRRNYQSQRSNLTVSYKIRQRFS